ncbi:MAG: hypothetical protein MI922_10955 [Bacteroidales bacterium]|nr:hypothetical protein [Bacteroidales bacterium]
METELEHIIMNAYKDQMMHFMYTHPGCFEEAAEMAISEREPFCWRATWLLHSCANDNDSRLQSYVDQFIDAIRGKRDGHQRELLKLLLRMNLNEDQEGRLFDLCVEIWEKINYRPSVRATAFNFIVATVKKYPDLKSEIEYFTQDQYLETLSPGIKRVIQRMAKEAFENGIE